MIVQALKMCTDDAGLKDLDIVGPCFVMLYLVSNLVLQTSR